MTETEAIYKFAVENNFEISDTETFDRAAVGARQKWPEAFDFATIMQPFLHDSSTDTIPSRVEFSITQPKSESKLIWPGYGHITINLRGSK